MTMDPPVSRIGGFHGLDRTLPGKKKQDLLNGWVFMVRILLTQHYQEAVAGQWRAGTPHYPLLSVLVHVKKKKNRHLGIKISLNAFQRVLDGSGWFWKIIALGYPLVS